MADAVLEQSVKLYRQPSKALLDLLDPNVPVHPDDSELVSTGELSSTDAKLLRVRRDAHFPNPIVGPVSNGTLSKWVLFAYCPPSLTTIPLTALISVWVISFYENLGASLGMLAFFQGLGRAFDIVVDPTMSFATDSMRSKMGRRRPFLATGCVPYAVAFFCLLCPWPHLSSMGVSSWFGVFYILFFWLVSYCNIPYDALAPELTDNQKDRATLMFTCTMFDGVGGIAVACLPAGFTYLVGWYRSASSAFRSCDNPVDGKINALSAVGPWLPGSTSAAPEAIADWVGTMTDSASFYGFSAANCTTAIQGPTPANATTAIADLYTWCSCVDKSQVIRNLDSLRYSYGLVGFVFGCYAIISLTICVLVVRERSQLAQADTHTENKRRDSLAGKPISNPSAEEEAPTREELGIEKPMPEGIEPSQTLHPNHSLVPGILNTMNNRPFRLLLPPWTLDSFANSLIGSLLIYFVRYVVRPESSNPELGCSPRGGDDMNWRCKTSLVTAASIMSYLFGALLFTPMWLILTRKYGKRPIWLFWSFMNGLTYLCYAVVGQGMVNLCIVMSIVNGSTAGAKFLNDAISADIIDYDEFLTGARAEATYTMFKAFLPKVAAIPASALPVALLATFGHVPLEDGIIQEQPASVRIFIVIVIVYIPAMLTWISAVYKMKFPFKTMKQIDMISEGVAQHLMGKTAQCPISGVMYQPIDFEADEFDSLDLVGYFPGFAVAKGLFEDPQKMIAQIFRNCIIQCALSLLWLVTFLAIACGTFFMLEGDNSYVPVLSIVAFGIGISASAFCGLRLRAAIRLRDEGVPKREIIYKIMKLREQMEATHQFSTQIFGTAAVRAI